MSKPLTSWVLPKEFKKKRSYLVHNKVNLTIMDGMVIIAKFNNSSSIFSNSHNNNNSIITGTSHLALKLTMRRAVKQMK